MYFNKKLSIFVSIKWETMLQNIKKIMELGEKVFEDATISITINYENIINEFEQVRLTKTLFNKIDISEDKIESFNITLKIERGHDKRDEYGDYIYEENWKSTRIEFYNSKKNYEEDDDYNEVEVDNPYSENYVYYNYDRLGDLSFKTYTDKTFIKIDEEDYDGENITRYNIYEIEQIESLFAYLKKLDNLLDEQYKERQLILESIVKNGKKILD